MPETFHVGDIVQITDQIDCVSTDIGTVRLVEQDEDATWLYIYANEEVLNIQIDPRIGLYWRIIEAGDPYLTKLSDPVE